MVEAKKRHKLLDWRWWLGMKPSFVVKASQSKFSVTVIIPAYNEEKHIENTIDSVKKQTAVIDEIIVIDDCSTDKTGEIARSMDVTVVRTKANQGTKAMAQNYAILKGLIKTDLFVTIDGDTVLDPAAIEKTLPYFNDEKASSVCGYVLPAKIDTVWERGRYIEYLFGNSLFKSAQNSIGAVLVSSGCFSVFRYDLVERIGGYKSRSMGEDMDLTWELAFMGYRVYFVEDAYCYVVDPPTLKIFVNQVDRWFRSYFQNIAIHKKNFTKNKGLMFIVFWYLIETLISPFLLVAAMFFLTKSLAMAFLYSIVLNWLIVMAVVIPKGIKKGMFLKTITSLPAYFPVRMVNLAIFWRSMWTEWIKKEKLTVWNKGH